jgi:DNA helicase-2/ATP-dependent DNA helicase PcrA
MQYDQLTDSQRKAVFHVEGPLLVLAGPGSGKTRVITYRIAALIESGVRPWNICAITFTNKAAEEMRQRVFALGTAAGTHISTFHSLCVRILRRYADRAEIRSNFSVYDASDQSRCMKQAVKNCELSTSNFPPARMLAAVSTLKNKLIEVADFEAQADDFFSKTLAKVYARYQGILTDANALDFDDLLMKNALMLRTCPDVCTELGGRFKFLLIDEYQDTNHAQYVIAKYMVSAHNNICATGDPDQSIYRWRGADIRNILAFETDWPDATIVKLEENFRSTPDILRAADNLISHNLSRKEKILIPTKPSGGQVDIVACEDEKKEAQTIVDKIKELIDGGTAANEIAVCYRVNAMSRGLEEQFIRTRTPYQIVRGVEFYNRKEIRDILAYMKILANPDDEIALLRIINTPARGIGKTTVDRVRDYASRCGIRPFDALQKAPEIPSLSNAAKAKIAVFRDLINGFKKDIDAKVTPLIERIFVESGLKKYLKALGPEGQTALENINELINAAAQYDKVAEEPSLLDYLQQIALFSDVDAYDASSGAVALMTLHAAKGLEFENVFIIGAEEGLLPHERSVTGPVEELEEERRLLFVGITRAKVNLLISFAQYRTFRGQLLRTIPSQFLFELGIEFRERAPDAASADYYPSEETDEDDEYDEYDEDEYPADAGVVKLKKGQLVRHRSFGLGRVVEFADMGEESIVTVAFNAGQTKTLMVKCAGLEVL